MEKVSENGRRPLLFLLKCLLFSYILTAVALVVLAFLLYRLGLTEKIVSVVIIAIYVGATFFGGFMAGKGMERRKFLWGLLTGAAYFLILAAVSLVSGNLAGGFGSSVLTTFVLCAAGGMLGGSISSASQPG